MATAQGRAAKKAVAKRTAKKAVAKKTAAPSAATVKALAELQEAHEAWKNELLRAAIEFAQDNGYCSEVEDFLEDQGFDVESLRKPLVFDVTMTINVDAGTRGNPEKVAQDIVAEFDNISYRFISAADVDDVYFENVTLIPTT